MKQYASSIVKGGEGGARNVAVNADNPADALCLVSGWIGNQPEYETEAELTITLVETAEEVLSADVEGMEEADVAAE